MKHIQKWYIVLVVFALTSACNEFLDKPPLTQFTDENYWTSENNVKVFCNGFYTYFNGFGTGTASSISAMPADASQSDFYFTTFTDDQAAFNGINIFPTSAPATSDTWSTPYTYIRLANLLLERIDKVSLGDNAKNHYKGIAYFFRAACYFELVKRFGDVPYIDKYLEQTKDEPLIFGGRVNRNTVMDKILVDLNNAVTLLYNKVTANAQTGVNTINKDVANALKSRICLYEGTYSKYHLNNTTRATAFLTESKTASQAVMSEPYTLLTTSKATYSTLNLTGNTETLLYRLYVAGITTHSVAGYTNSSTTISGLSKDVVDAFLCTDGLPISTSTLYQGDAPTGTKNNRITNSTMKNRDKRLGESIDDSICYLGNLSGRGFSSTTGYRVSRFDNAGMTATELLAPNNVTDAPIFWLAEILLNYAESCVELGSFTQTDADNSIKKLRARSGITVTFDVANIVDDPKRDADVSPLLWEIRRERRIELLMTSSRHWDLRRWKKLKYLDPNTKPDIFKGTKIVGTAPTGLNVDENNYIVPFTANVIATRVIDEAKHYCDPIPTEQIQLYVNKGVEFKQNTGW